MHSIRIKMAAITVVAILVSFSAFAVIGFLTVGNEFERTSTEKLNLLSENMKKSLDEYLNSVKQSVEMASHIAVDSLDSIALVEGGVAGVTAKENGQTPEQAEELDEYLSLHCAQVQETFSSVASHTNGVVTYYYCLSPEISKNVHGFFYSKVGKAGFEEREPIDARQLDPEDLEHTTWYFTTINRGRPSWVGPYKAHFLGELWTISYLTPIYKAGTLIGVMGMDILLDTFISRIQSLKVYDTGFACLFDGQGNILYHPRLEIGSNADTLGATFDTAVLLDKQSGDNTYRYFIDGEERQLSFSTLISGMKLVVVAPVKEINESWTRLMQFFIMVGALILAVFAVTTVLLMGAVTKPLQRLSNASRRLAAGDYDVELNYESSDEIGVLTDSFRQMRDHVKLYISDLNSKVYKDALTGIKNKAAFDVSSRRLNDAILHASDGTSVQFALVMLDCNCLKVINDEYGHERGDIYLQTASDAICRTFTHSPVFRLGGDEFAVLLQRTDYEKRGQLMDKFDANAEAINRAATQPWEKVDMAKGLSVFRPGEDRDVEEVLRRADERMYEDKRKKKSRG